MHEEIEVKFLEVDVSDIREKLKALGASLVGTYNYKRKLLDYPDLRLDAKHSWIRLRDEGEKITLTFKERKVGEHMLHDLGMKEIEIEVSGFDTTNQFLLAIGLIEKRYEENKRERWLLGDVECDIDTWPMIPTYIELEGPSIEAIKVVSDKLGFNWEEHLVCSAGQVFKHYGISKDSFSVITFDRQIKKPL